MRVVAKLIAQDAEGAGGVAEAAGDVGGRLVLDEVSTEGFILALHGELRGQEEVLVAGRRYLIGSAVLHISIVLQKQGVLNMFREETAHYVSSIGSQGINCAQWRLGA